MNARLVSLALVPAALLLAVACRKEPSRGGATTKPPPAEGPCAVDADCAVYLEPCSCGCLAHVGSEPMVPNELWGKMCSGAPPPNCGVASPCMNVKARCDATTKRCALVR